MYVRFVQFNHLIQGYNHPKAYVAAQGPLANTVGDFWRMMWEFQLPTVVMLTELVERGIVSKGTIITLFLYVDG